MWDVLFCGLKLKVLELHTSSIGIIHDGFIEIIEDYFTEISFSCHLLLQMPFKVPMIDRSFKPRA